MATHNSVEKGVPVGHPDDVGEPLTKRVKRQAKHEAKIQAIKKNYLKRPEDARVLAVDDGYADTRIKHWLFDLPARIALVGRSESAGKTTFLLNMLLRFYDPSPWKGADIYIISGTAKVDKKVKILSSKMGVPEENVHSQYSDALVDRIHSQIIERREKDKMLRSLIILDDVTDKLNARQNAGAIGNLAYQSRHDGCTIILSTQKWSMVPTGFRENLSGAVVWGCSQRQAVSIAHDLNRFENSNTFLRMLQNCTSGNPHNFLVVRLNKPVKDMCLDYHFKPIRPRTAAMDDQGEEGVMGMSDSESDDDGDKKPAPK